MEKYPRGSEYNIWTAIKQRCYNRHAYGYKYYGEKGVTVQEDWVDNFSKFMNDMGPKPGPDYILTRKNPEGNFDKENCCWVQSGIGRPVKKRIEYEGQEYTFKEFSKEFKIGLQKLYYWDRVGRDLTELIDG